MKPGKSIYIILALLGIVILFGGLEWYKSSSSPAATNTKNTNKEIQLIIYSGRKEPLILPIIEAFEKKTGIKTTIKSGSSQELTNLLLEEKDKTQADIFISTDAGLLEKLAIEKMFTPITTDLSHVPAEYKSKDKLWTGVSGRARVLIINTDLVSQNDKPDSVYDIAEPQWKGKVAMANMANENLVTHISALRVLHDDTFAADFINGLRENQVTKLTSHTDVRKAVAKGEFAVGLVNHYYGHLQQQESNNIEIIYPDQKEGEDGVFINAAGVGILKYGKNTPQAQEFITYLLSDEAQKKFAELNFEFPLRTGIRSTNTKNLGEFKKMNVDLHTVSKKIDETLKFIKQNGS